MTTTRRSTWAAAVGLALVAAVVLPNLASSPAAAASASTATQSSPASTWVQPGTDLVDAVGTYLYIEAPQPGSSQLSPYGYAHELTFTFASGATGMLRLGTSGEPGQTGRKVAGLLMPQASTPRVEIPFDWSFGHFYFLLAYRLGDGLWGGWVYDWSTSAWTYMGQIQTPSTWGRLAPQAKTVVTWDGNVSTPTVTADGCARYPLIDSYLYPPLAWRGSTVTVATFTGHSVATAGTCPSQPAIQPDGWARYHLGAAAPSTTSVMFGAATDGGPSDLSGLTSFESHAGKNVSLYGYYQSFSYDTDFNTVPANAIRAHGATPMITWEPWDPSVASATQPTYALSRIADGSHDALISRWASEIKAWGQPLWLRFAHEMNGDWYPWAEGVNGNTAGQYVAAWRHVHDLFVAAGVTNVTWVWTPNVLIPGTPALSSLYPGDAYVDWVGLDGYNWGTTNPSWSTWQSPDQVFGSTLAGLRQLTTKPIVIGETASTELGGSKSQWIQQFFSTLAANPDVRAFVWFNYNKETDWRIESSAGAQSAFAAGVANSRYS